MRQIKYNKQRGKSIIRKLKESAFIHYVDQIISQTSFDISPMWLPIMKPELGKIDELYKSRVDIDNPWLPSVLVASNPSHSLDKKFGGLNPGFTRW